MVITMSVILLFTYPSLSLHSQGIITILYDLQMFPCPQIVPQHVSTVSQTQVTGTSGVLVTFGMVHRHLEASDTEMTFGAILCFLEGSPLDLA
jgi:hypothetical protein